MVLIHTLEKSSSEFWTQTITPYWLQGLELSRGRCSGCNVLYLTITQEFDGGFTQA
jgi:hypothetical protein